MAMLSSLVHTVRKARAKQRVKYGVWVSLTGNTQTRGTKFGLGTAPCSPSETSR